MPLKFMPRAGYYWLPPVKKDGVINFRTRMKYPLVLPASTATGGDVYSCQSC